MIQEKIKGESIADARLREERPEEVGRPELAPEEIERVAQPFGNSATQNKASGLEGWKPTVVKPRDRKERWSE
jgi:hypothetical protein